jgi:hypothetical protein
LTVCPAKSKDGTTRQIYDTLDRPAQLITHISNKQASKKFVFLIKKTGFEAIFFWGA